MAAGRGTSLLETTLTDYERAIDTLLEAIASSNSIKAASGRTNLEHAIDAVATVDDALVIAVDEVYQHRLNSVKIAALKAESDALDAELDGAMSGLAEMHAKLLRSSDIFNTRAQKQQPSRPGQEGTGTDATVGHRKVDYTTLIKYAERIARTAPGQGQTPESVASTIMHLPWPSEDMMRRGVLANGPHQRVKGPGNLLLQELTSRPSSSRQPGADSTSKASDSHVQPADPTAKPVFDVLNGGEDGRTGHHAAADAPASSAAVLDLDLFDPDEDD